MPSESVVVSSETGVAVVCYPLMQTVYKWALPVPVPSVTQSELFRSFAEVSSMALDPRTTWRVNRTPHTLEKLASLSGLLGGAGWANVVRHRNPKNLLSNMITWS